MKTLPKLSGLTPEQKRLMCAEACGAEARRLENDRISGFAHSLCSTNGPRPGEPVGANVRLMAMQFENHSSNDYWREPTPEEVDAAVSEFLRFEPSEYPKYDECLNAMAEAEATLTPSQAVKFRMRLQLNSDGPNAKHISIEAAMCHASASERLDAFLIAKGLARP